MLALDLQSRPWLRALSRSRGTASQGHPGDYVNRKQVSRTVIRAGCRFQDDPEHPSGHSGLGAGATCGSVTIPRGNQCDYHTNMDAQQPRTARIYDASSAFSSRWLFLSVCARGRPRAAGRTPRLDDARFFVWVPFFLHQPLPLFGVRAPSHGRLGYLWRPVPL